ILPLPWWLRNMRVYGLDDPLGLQRHAQVVTGQPRTTAWITTHGWSAYLERLLSFTFESFWGVFGWLGVFLDSRIYQILAVLSLLLFVGLAWQVREMWHHRQRLSQFQRLGLFLLLLQLLGVIATYAWYNLSFVQHQGRYLFPALLPISLGVALGLEGIFSFEGSRWGLVALLAVALVMGGWGLWRGNLPGWLLLFLGVAAVGLALNRHWSWLRLRSGALLVFTLLFLIALQALFGAIVPQLTP
ncbi:MAG: hypothetical protein GXP38_02600, partial [Chloroflexi bacterium]|nr:hypothetical protein [Chloroflexota bacterium]